MGSGLMQGKQAVQEPSSALAVQYTAAKLTKNLSLALSFRALFVCTSLNCVNGQNRLKSPIIDTCQEALARVLQAAKALTRCQLSGLT